MKGQTREMLSCPMSHNTFLEDLGSHYPALGYIDNTKLGGWGMGIQSKKC